MALLARLLFAGPIGLAEIAMLLGFALALPYTLVGFWNAVIGWAVMRGGAGNARQGSGFALDAVGPLPTAGGRCAVLMTLRNETPEPVFARLAAMADSLRLQGDQARNFCFVVLSDSDDADILAREASLFADFAAACVGRPTPVYRHRQHNDGYKAGNIMAYLDHDDGNRGGGDAFDYFLPLDADSLMSGRVMVALLAAMQANPQIGILQTLVVGLPGTSIFARVFQFGMRHAMRAFTAGAAWWSADCGAYWGHNAMVRVAPFRAHCRLPRIRRGGVLSGAVMSHDRLEAAFMRRAGFEVRVAAMECESFEINPPTLVDFIRRELRWCQGNLQYAWFIAIPGLQRTSRVQLALAMLMYLAAAAWLTMTAAACMRAADGGFAPGAMRLGVLLFVGVFLLSIAPKIIGASSVAGNVTARRRYGPPALFGLSVLLELLLSMLMAPVVALAISLFIAGLPLGRRLGWPAQRRRAQGLSWATALRQMGMATSVGLALALWLSSSGAGLLVWAAPFLIGLLVSVPLTAITARRCDTHWCKRRLFVIPEEQCTPPIVETQRRAEDGVDRQVAASACSGRSAAARATSPAQAERAE